MAIILDIHNLEENTYRAYLEKTLFKALAVSMPGKTFLYPANKIENIDLPANMKPVIFPPKKGFFLQKKNNIWIKKHQASGFISFENVLKTTEPIKQILIIDNYPSLKKEKAILKADQIGFTTSYLQHHFLDKHSSYLSRTFLAEGIVNELDAEIDDRKKILIKNENTAAQEYFVCSDFELNQDKLTMLLKAFSAFKKMQQTGWKLMIIIRNNNAIKMGKAQTLLSNYKYRGDVVLTNDADIYAKTAAAYSLINIDEDEIFPVSVQEAINVGTPIIAVETKTKRSIYGDLLVYASGNNSNAIGEMMMTMYKGETFRQKLIKRIADWDNKLNLQNATAQLKQLIAD